MSCKRIQRLLAEQQTRKLSEQEKVNMQAHINGCTKCSDALKQNRILSSIIRESSDIDSLYIIPQEIMRTRVEKQIQSVRGTSSIGSSLKKRILIPFVATFIIIVGLILFNNANNSTPYEYTVAFDGVNIEIVEDDNILCDIFNTYGLPEASIDVIGCDTTCELVIFDLKSQQEAEKVIEILRTIDRNLKSTNIIKVKQYHI